ncbi:carbon starvation CstA family protein [Steroidobacter flavus]|uniref:Carbon starvation CstA family protein n=1 Tax=Steroidobacter flavus TaxID=1842136 RepID=A0ABV8SRU2_9GAMM
MLRKGFWILVALIGAFAVGGIALHRGETINAMWIVVAALCIYSLGYRFYSAWVAAKVLSVDPTRATPALRLNNGRDFMPTHRWIVFGHHFAAIAGPGPLIGPTLAAQFGYLPGTLWILVGGVLGGCVQDMTILFLSTRRNGRSLGQMARDELGPVGGFAAMLGTLTIMIILIAVLGLVVVNAMKHSPWATATVFATIPIAVLVGVYLRNIRPGRVLEGSLIGLALLLFAVVGGGWVDSHPALRELFNLQGKPLAWFVIGYGFIAAVLPVWLLLAPRDYLSTFLKLGTVMLLALAVILMRPEIHMPAVTQFIDGSGPIFGGALFPFVFITIACGAISGFHALVSSGTTPKLIGNESDVRLIGYGSMMLESFVAIMAMIAATLLQPGVYFAINSAPGIVGATAEAAVATITSWGFPVTVDQMAFLAKEMGESTLFARTGGAPSLAVGMASIFSSAFGESMLAIWYHFAIMFEAVFILTTLDAGTRVGRFMLQDALSHVWKPMGETSWYPSVLISSGLVVAGWGYFLYIGVVDPNGGINILWPLFGIANQLLAGIALSVATGILIKQGKLRFSWVTGAPLLWLAIVTTSATWEKVVSSDPRIGFLAAANQMAAKLASGAMPPEQAAVAPQLIFNQRLDAVLAVLLSAILWVVIADMVRVSLRVMRGQPVPPNSEAPHVHIGSVKLGAEAT